MGCAVDSCQGIFRLSSWVHPRNRRPRLFLTKVRVHLLPQPTIHNILLDPPFCGVVHHPHTRHYQRVQQDMAATPERLQVRSLSLRHLAAIASGERPGPTSFQPAPLLPFRPALPGPPAGKRSRRSFSILKSGSKTRIRRYRRTPGLPPRLLLADAAVSSKCTLQSKTPKLQIRRTSSSWHS